MSRRTVEDKEIPLPYKWKIDRELQSLVRATPAPPKKYTNKSSYQYWSQKAYKYYHEGNFNRAIKSFDKSLEIRSNAGACLGKASVFETLRKYDEAITCYDDYLKKQRDDHYEVAEVYWNKGSLLAKLERYTEAIQSYKKSERLGFDSQLDIIGLFGQMGKYSEVIQRSEKVVKSRDTTYSPDDKIRARFFKANALDALGNFDEAIKHYNQVITARPYRSAIALYYRGRAKVKNGNIRRGLSDLKAAIERNNMYQEFANIDRDFESIRNDPIFRSIVAKS